MSEWVDIRVLSFMSGTVSVLIFGGLLAISLGRKTYDGFICWLGASIFTIPGGLLLSLRGYIPEIFSVVLSNTLLSGVSTLLACGLIRFVGLKVNRHIMVTLPLVTVAALLSFFNYVVPSVNARIVVVTGCFSAYTFLAGYISYVYVPRLFDESNRKQSLLFFTLGLFGIFRIVVTLTHSSTAGDYMQFTGIHAISTMIITLMVFAVYFSLINLNLRRVEHDLRSSLSEVQTLRGLLPICSMCKRIRTTEGYWQRLEDYLTSNSEAEFSNIICDDCKREGLGIPPAPEQ